MRKNYVKEKLKNGELVVGALLPFFSPAVVEIIGHAGYDFVTLDAEHGPLGAIEIEAMVRAADHVGLIPFVRVDSGSSSSILHSLDSGALGVQIPHICNRMDAEAAVQAIKYHPLGRRGLAGSVRAAKYSSMRTEDYIRDSNENTLVMIQIEDIDSMPHLKEILGVKGIDVVFIGRNDLAHSMGFANQQEHPDVQRVVDEIFSTSLGYGVSVAVSTDVEHSHEWIKKGARLISLSFAPILLKTWKKMADEVRKHG
jgi:4-hydroxy-2-oxoheptanedioate aldolase